MIVKVTDTETRYVLICLPVDDGYTYLMISAKTTYHIIQIHLSKELIAGFFKSYLRPVEIEEGGEQGGRVERFAAFPDFCQA